MSSSEFTEHLAYYSATVPPIDIIETYMQYICLLIDRGPSVLEKGARPPELDDYKITFERVSPEDESETEQESNSIFGVMSLWKAQVNADHEQKSAKKGRFK